LREAMAEQEWVDVMCLLPVFGNQSRLAFEYAEKFNIHPMKIKVKKLLRLLTDIAGLFKTGKFVLNRREYEVSQRGIVEALTIVNNKNFEQPLENHNYLKKVLASIADKERTESRSALDAEQRRNETEKRRTGETETKTQNREMPLCGTDEPGEYLTPAEIKKRARELTEKIGTRS
jgi:hypothetical protein